MQTVQSAALAVLVCFATVFAPGVALADPSDSGSGSTGSSGTSSGPAGGNQPSGKASNDGDSSAAGGSSNSDSGDGPNSKIGSTPDGVGSSPRGSAPANDGSPETESELADELTKIDAEVSDVVALRNQIDNDPSVDPEIVRLADSEADTLVQEQQLVHQIAEQQGIPAPQLPAAAPLPTNMSLDTVMTMVNTDRANMLDAQVSTQAAVIKAQTDELAELNAKLQDPNLSPAERDGVQTEIDSLTNRSRQQMVELQSIVTKFNKTTEGLAQWLAKDSRATNTTLGNLR